MMIDADVAACSPASVYRVLKKAGLLAGQSPTTTKKGTGFVQPLQPTNIGISMSATSTSPARFTSSAPSSMAAVDSWFTGKSAKKWRNPTWK
ncbi:MAG TPA: hypothetical protein VFE62_00875 [Gemmataceae bacterium]|nr:hypothetical protein [Gemmataceae bacterium]